MINGKCNQCGKEIRFFKSQERKFCSLSCATTFRNLTDKNPSYTRDINGDKNPMFGKGRVGSLNGMFGKILSLAPRWNGGKKKRKDGYVLVVCSSEHPHPAETRKSGLCYILEHRAVMEKHLGRYLLPGEVVHHKNGNPSDNRIDNLELVTNQSEHIRKHHGSH